MMLSEGFRTFAKAHSLSVKSESEAENECLYSFKIRGVKGNYDSFGLCMEEERLFTVVIDLNIRIKEQGRTAAASILTELNYPLKMGVIQMDPQTGALTVRASQYIYGTDWEQTAQIERVVLLAGMIADTYCYEIIKRLPE